MQSVKTATMYMPVTTSLDSRFLSWAVNPSHWATGAPRFWEIGHHWPSNVAPLPKRTETSITSLQTHKVSACIQVWQLSTTSYNTLHNSNLRLSCKVVLAWYFSTATILNDTSNISKNKV